MKALNNFVWYSGYAVSIIIIAVLFFTLTDDLTIQIPVVIGIFGAIVAIATTSGDEDGLGLPKDTGYPVPFVGLSKMVGYQIFRLAKSGLTFMGMFAVSLEHGFIVAAIVGLITIPIGLFLLLMAVCIIPFSLVSDGLFLLATLIAKSIDIGQYETNTDRFICPECGSMSNRPSYDADGKLIKGLSPSIRGIFHVEMEHSKVPCFGSKGKRKDVPQYCPDCGMAVETKEGKPWVVSMAGAPSSGKTSFVMSVCGKAAGTACGGAASSVGFYFPRDESMLTDYRAGICRPTPERFESPCILCIGSKRPTQRLVYMADVSGNFFSPNGSEVDLQPQYAYNDAIVFTIDPTCPSPESRSYDAYVGFLEKYRQFNKLDASKRIAVPLAVVLTRADKAGPFDGVADADLAGKMAEEGYMKLINSIEKDFSSVAYFSCDVSKENGAAGAVIRHLCEKSGADVKEFFRERL
jgi:hypothetical protein